MEEVAKFLFVGAAAVALFTFLTVSTWVGTRAAERRDRERLALLRKVAEQPPETVAVLRELLHEEDARLEQLARQKARDARREGLQGGTVIVAVGVGLSTFLYRIVPNKPVWTLGLMLILAGIVIVAFAWFARPEGAPRTITTGSRSSS